MRSGSRFSDYAQYYPAALTLNRWLQALSLQGAPGMFSDFSIDRDEVDVNFCNLEELSSPDVLMESSARSCPIFGIPRRGWSARIRMSSASA